MATTQPQRIQTIDAVRGVAVMGILLMNIVAFSMPEAAYMNPRAYGGAQGADLAVYLFNFILFDGKMRGLFSFLFGASLLLIVERAAAKGESPARVHYARMFWLFLFGLAHLWLLWWGDILNHYAVIGAFAFLFRKLRVRTLVMIGIGLVAFEWLFLALLPFSYSMAEAGLPDAKQAAKSLAEFQRNFGAPSADAIAKDLALHRGPYADLLQARFLKHRFDWIGTNFFVGAETLGYMLFGMASLKSGLLTGAWEAARYRRWALIGFGISLPVYAALAWFLVSQGFTVRAVLWGVIWAPVPFRAMMIAAWACLIVLGVRGGGALSERLAATGRMAFTNYLVTTICMTFLFYGQGLGLYGHLSRWQVYGPALAMIALMLLWSKPWLARFRYGPFEWLWRSLARLRLQPIRGAAATG